jgi:hypothetical protein
MSEAKAAVVADKTFDVAVLGAGLKGRQKHFYAAASQLYGWAQHAHHWPSAPVKLTADQFAEALDRASKYPGVELLDAAKSKHFGA